MNCKYLLHGVQEPLTASVRLRQWMYMPLLPLLPLLECKTEVDRRPLFFRTDSFPNHTCTVLAMTDSTQPSADSRGRKHSDDASISGWKDKACRVCDSFSFFKKSMSHQAASGTEQTTSSTASDAHGAPPAADDTWTTPDGALPCPPDYTDLGNSTWTFLHTVASYYPEQPSEQVHWGALCVCVH